MFASRVDAETLVKIVPRLALARVTRQLCERPLQIAKIMACLLRTPCRIGVIPNTVKISSGPRPEPILRHLSARFPFHL